MIKQLDTLYGLSKTGKVKQWTITAVQNPDGTAIIETESGYIDGKLKTSSKLIKEGKNIGKANETSPFEQALSEIKSTWKRKLDKNYEPFIINPNTYIPRVMLPMLASDVGKGNIIYPCYIQSKLNGICDLAEIKNKKILHHSRGGKLFTTVPHLDKSLLEINPPAPPHGELYKHGWSLQKIGSYTKELKSDYHLLEFWVYDIAWLGKTFEERINYLSSVLSIDGNPVRLTPTKLVNSYEEAKDFHDESVVNGFEGSMLKNVNGLYIFEFNSKDIEKMKEFKDSEFKIIGGKEGIGADEGCIIYRCITEQGEEFDVRPRGSVEERQEMYRDLANDIGKMLTVRYPELTDSGKPSQPVGIAVRDYE